MHKKIYFPLVIFNILFCILSVSLKAVVLTPALQSALSSVRAEEELSVIIKLTKKFNLSFFRNKNKRIRRSEIIKALKSQTTLTQRPLRTFLKARRVNNIRPLWIINGMALTCRKDVIRALANQPGVESIRLD